MRAIFLLFLLVSSCLAQGDPRSRSIYGEAMNNLTGSSPNRNEMRGIDLMNQAADRGYLPAIVALGTIYDAGLYTASSPSKAADLYRKAAGQGSHFSEYLLGRIYFTGKYGTRRDGESWLESAANAGNEFAAYLLGVSLYDRDPVGAVPWLRRAAEQGLPHAQYRLGKALLQGGRVPIDKRQAYLWLYVAQEAGITQARTDLSLLDPEFGGPAGDALKTEARDLRNKVRRAANPTQCKGWQGELDAVPTIPPLELLPDCDVQTAAPF